MTIDEEREALIDALVMTPLTDYGATMKDVRRTADAILAAGFQQATHEPSEADIIEQLADEVDLSEFYPNGLSEYHNAEAAVETWLRRRAARARQVGTQPTEGGERR